MAYFFDELNNGQTVMHYSRHCLTKSLAYVTTLTNWTIRASQRCR